MKIKTSDLTGAALDWAVAKAEGVPAELLTYFKNTGALVVTRAIGRSERLDYSTDWAQGGPIIDREEIATRKSKGIWYAMLSSHLGDGERAGWHKGAWVTSNTYVQRRYGGPTPLVAAMRCRVASKLGDEVDVPEELCS